MTIAVVIPTLNEHATLPHTLPHTARLGFDAIVVVDGGSTDRTRAFVQETAAALSSELTPITCLTSPPGRANQMNRGASVSTADVLIFLHADTYLPSDARPAIETVLADPDCVGGRFDVKFERDTGWGWLVSRMMNVRSRLSGISTGDQALFVRRSAFERVGGFPQTPIMEDIEFSRRLKRVGRVAALRSYVLTSFRRWESCGPVRTVVRMWTLRLLYWAGVSPARLSQFYRTVR